MIIDKYFFKAYATLVFFLCVAALCIIAFGMLMEQFGVLAIFIIFIIGWMAWAANALASVKRRNAK